MSGWDQDASAIAISVPSLNSADRASEARRPRSTHSY